MGSYFYSLLPGFSMTSHLMGIKAEKSLCSMSKVRICLYFWGPGCKRPAHPQQPAKLIQYFQFWDEKGETQQGFLPRFQAMLSVCESQIRTLSTWPQSCDHCAVAGWHRNCTKFLNNSFIFQPPWVCDSIAVWLSTIRLHHRKKFLFLSKKKIPFNLMNVTSYANSDSHIHRI